MNDKYTKSIQNGAAGFYNLLRVLLILIMVAVGKCIFGQTLFRFYTAETEIAIDTGKMEAYKATMLVCAIADTVAVLIPSTQAIALKLFGFTWVACGDGFEGSGVNGWAKYSEGPSGKTLEIKSGALHLVCRERCSRKTTRL